MADTKITALTEDTAPAGADYFVTVDVSDTTMDAGGSDKKVQVRTMIGLTASRPTAMYATTANLSATYSNGGSGVGATLTNTSMAPIGSLDGQSIANGQTGIVVLVKDQTTAFQNGLYTMLTGGPGGAWVMTRHPLMDSPGQFGGAVVAVELGTANGNSLWLCPVHTPTVGTTSVTFSQLNAASAGANSLGTYVVQTSTNAPANAQVLASLSTGLVKVTTTTGVLSTATAGTDYVTPSGSGASLTSLNASNLASGTVPTARLGSGTASSSTYLKGDQTYGLPLNLLVTATDASTVTFNLAISNLQIVTLGGNRTLALSNVTTGQPFQLLLKQDGSVGSRTVTWFSGITWAAGSAPTLSTAINKVDTFAFINTSSGAYLGYVVAQGQ